LTRGEGRTERSYTKETKDQWPPDKKLKTTSQKRALAEPFALQAHFNAARCRFFSLFFTLFPRTANQAGSIYFIFASPVRLSASGRLLALHEKSS
jgi:hypothetical protein